MQGQKVPSMGSLVDLTQLRKESVDFNIDLLKLPKMKYKGENE